jgi:hypothetical protein
LVGYFYLNRTKARGGLEPPFKDLQSSTLPLCYLAEIKKL